MGRRRLERDRRCEAHITRAGDNDVGGSLRHVCLLYPFMQTLDLSVRSCCKHWLERRESPVMSKAMQELLSILDLETLEHNLFRGRSPQVGWQRVFGGQVIGQALVAAQRTVDAQRHVHSLHGYFMRAGDPKVPIIYEVDRIRDGSSFTTRRVVAIQHGHAIFSLEASFQIEEAGLEHQIPRPLDVVAPEQ